MIFDSVLETIGNTPVIRLAALSARLGVSVYAKMESFNPGGSHKVRIALGMILDAERKGILIRHTGQVIIEPSGGNTGIGLVMAGNLLGYHVMLVIPDNYSPDKQKLLRLYGAEVVLSDSRRGNNSHGEKAIRILLEHPEYVMLNQQHNPANTQTHRQTTAAEILEDFAQTPLDYFVGGIGTGGHITGIGERLKAHWKHLRIYGVEPEECDLFSNVHRPHDIQGLSVGIIPSILNISLLDGMIGVSRGECIDMIRKVMSTDAISPGISSAASLVAVTKLARDIRPGSRVLTLIYDDIDAYLSYFD